MTRRRRVAGGDGIPWEAALPYEVGSFAPPDLELSVEHDELGRRFLTVAVEQTRSDLAPPGDFDDEDDELDPSDALDLLLHFAFESPSRKRRGREPPTGMSSTVALAPARIPEDFDEYLSDVDEIDLTNDHGHDASLLDHETDELGEVVSPRLRTEDTHCHGKPRGGHARSTIRPNGRAR